jgi:hypothetical protein
VHVHLGGSAVYEFSYGGTIIGGEIIAHIPAPEPVVRWHNVYVSHDRENFYLSRSHLSRDAADTDAGLTRIGVLRVEWLDGGRGKKSIMTMEGV